MKMSDVEGESKTELLAQILERIAAMVRRHAEGDLEGAAWRMADAGGFLIEISAESRIETQKVMGIGFPTGAGNQIVSR